MVASTLIRTHMLAAEDSSSIFFWSMVLLALLGAGWAVVVMVKKWANTPEDPVSTGFTLSDLRQMHRSGQMSAEEFERAKGAIVAAAQAAAKRKEAAKDASARKRSLDMDV